MTKSIKYSILLPGSFFDDQWKSKIHLVQEKINCNTIYFFDHSVNPVNSSSSVYNQFEAIQKTLDYKKNIRLGTLVTNLKRKSADEICSSLRHIVSSTDCFDFGIGIGDDKYEKSLNIDYINIHESIELILNSFNFDKESFSMFIGGTSEYVSSIAEEYDLGINIWNKNEDYVSKKFKEFGTRNRGRNSFTVHQGSLETKGNTPKYCEEIIFVTKDSSFDEFTKQLDSIKGWIET